MICMKQSANSENLEKIVTNESLEIILIIQPLSWIILKPNNRIILTTVNGRHVKKFGIAIPFLQPLNSRLFNAAPHIARARLIERARLLQYWHYKDEKPDCRDPGIYIKYSAHEKILYEK